MASLSGTNAIQRQRTAFYFALATFLGVVIWIGIRIHFAILDDPDADRQFVLRSIELVPILGLSWIASFIIVGNSFVESKRLSWYGIITIAMLAVLGVPVAIGVLVSFWHFWVSL